MPFDRPVSIGESTGQDYSATFQDYTRYSQDEASHKFFLQTQLPPGSEYLKVFVVNYLINCG